MEGECFNCMGEASDRYTLILDKGKTLEDKLLCEPCASAFRDTEWIEVHEAPVRMRGGNGNDHKAAESGDSG